MAAHMAFPLTRQPRHSWLAPIDQLSNFGSTIIEGLGAFGLAANGVCPTLFRETAPLQSESLPSAGNGPRR
jgi:hypothetical protein